MQRRHEHVRPFGHAEIAVAVVFNRYPSNWPEITSMICKWYASASCVCKGILQWRWTISLTFIYCVTVWAHTEKELQLLKLETTGRQRKVQRYLWPSSTKSFPVQHSRICCLYHSVRMWLKFPDISVVLLDTMKFTRKSEVISQDKTRAQNHDIRN